VLLWNTASEKNNDYFAVERSRNGSDFESIANVKGAGTTSEANSYSFTDTNPYGGLSYYRLHQTDFDLRSSYSKLVAVTMPETNWSIYPNPSDGSTIQLDLPKEYLSKSLVITFVDARGAIVKTQTFSTDEQRLTITSETPLSDGIYTVILTDGYSQSIKRLAISK